MGDLKISQLTDAGALAGGDQVPVADASDLTTSKSTTLTKIQTFVKNLATGGTGAGSAPLNMTAGSLLTTPEDGAIEMDADCFYGTVDSGNRGVIQTNHFIRARTGKTLASQTTTQPLFTNGTLTLETGIYFFDAQIALTSMSTTSGNTKFFLKGAGTATLANVLYRTVGQDLASDAGGQTVSGMWFTTSDTSANVVSGGTSQSVFFEAKGTFEVTVAGTFEPAVGLTNTATPTVSSGSYIRCSRMGATTVLSVGQWT